MANLPMTDETPMPYGKYKGKKMAEVPDYYLLFIWENHDLRDPLKTYISNNLDAVKENVKKSQQKKNANK